MAFPQIAADSPQVADVRALLSAHLAVMRSQSPPESVFALDAAGLVDPAVTFYTCRRDGRLLAMGALRELSARHGEVKSMHTAGSARRMGIGRAMLIHLIAVARDRGYTLLSLETGSMAGFEPARRLYAAAGFAECGPFGDYAASPYSTFMSLAL